MDVSIIIVNYNAFDLLKNCLESLVSHTHGIDYELIVIDNNSTQGNVELVTSKFPQIRLIKNDENKGFGAANNQGLEVATGSFILFLNNDTEFFENSIKKVYDYSLSIPHDCMIGCKLLNSDRSLQASTYAFPSVLNVFTSNIFLYKIFPESSYFNKYYLINKKVDTISETDVITGAFIFAPRYLLNKLKGFDEEFYFYNEDTDLCYRFKRHFGKIIYFPLTSVIHHKGVATGNNNWFKYKNTNIATLKYFKKHFGKTKYFTATIINIFGVLIRSSLLLILGVFTLRKDKLTDSFNRIKAIFVCR